MKKTRKIVSFLLAVLILVSTFTINSSVVFAASVKTPKLTKITSKTTSITIKWKKQSNISGYAIYQRKGDNKFKRVATVSKNATSYTKGSLTSATKYTYYIKSYTKSRKGKYTYSTKSNSLNIYTKPAKPKISSITSPTSTSIKLKWSKISRINGYVLYRKSGDKYIKVTDISAKSTSYTVKKLKEYKKYYYAMRAYKVVNGKRVYGPYSAIASIYTKHTHKYTKNVIKSTCTKSGYTKNTCINCAYSYKDTQTSALGHNYNNSVVKPTCTEAGYTTHSCKRCGHYYTDNKTQATGHQNITTKTKAATCSKEGSIKEICGVCDTTIKTTTIPTTAHSYVTKTCAEAYKEISEYNTKLQTKHPDTYKYKTDYMCNICSTCHKIQQDTKNSVWSKYSDEEQSKIMMGYVNNLRKEYSKENPYHFNIIHDKVELVYDAKLTELANIRAKEISINFDHFGGTQTSAFECIAGNYDTIPEVFEAWRKSTGHFDVMIVSSGVRFGYGRYVDENNMVFNVLLIWDKLIDAEIWEETYGHLNGN